MALLLFLVALLVAGPARAQDTDAPEELPILDGPHLLEFVEAVWPPEALEAGLEATVILVVELDETGAVVSVEVAETVGNGFDEAAVEAARQMRFGPAITEAGPIPVVFELPYHFDLKPEVSEEEVEAPINLDGEVVQMPTRRPIPNARVVVDGTDLVATTDEAGRFSLRGVPAGPQVVRALALGHTATDAKIDIADGEIVTWRFWLRPETYRDNEAVAVYDVAQEEVTRRTLTIEEVRRVPGTFGDPIKVIQTLPGAARSPFGTGLLVIRGANPQDSGVYVDGVRLPIIYHLTGTTSVLSPELISEVDYLPGGFAGQYGRSMGGVIEVKTKDEFEDAKLVWGTDILDSQVYFEGNLGKNKQHGVAVGARRSYVDAFIPLFAAADGFTVRPVYWDYQAKWVPKLEGDQDFSVFVYGFQDTLTVATPDDVTQGSDQDTQGDLRTMYASQRVAVRYHKRFDDTLSLLVAPSFGVDYNDFSLGGEFRLASLNGVGQLRTELSWTPTPALTLVPGLDLIGGWYSFQFKSPYRFEALDDPLAEREGADTAGRGMAMGPDVYVKALIRPLEDRERWLITPNFRFSSVIYTYGGELFDFDSQRRVWGQYGLDPRISTRFAVTDAFLVKGATGLYTQPPQPYQSIGFGQDVKLSFERALNSSVGFEHRLSQAVRWDVELFHRQMYDLVVFNPGFEGYGDQNWINGGQGRAYGAEVIVRHAPVKRFFGWISYTLSKSERRDSPTQAWFPFDFDQTHILSAQGGYELPLGFDVSAQVQYVTGNPTSLYNAGVYDLDTDSYAGFRIGAPNADRLPSFLQTSVRLDKLWTFKRWQLDTYVELINLIRGVNPEFTLYAYDYSEYAYVRGLPFIPNIGIELRFWP